MVFLIRRLTEKGVKRFRQFYVEACAAFRGYKGRSGAERRETVERAFG
ncbi:hypothetical protein PAMC26510_08845 [Caballeronia sordidicola]|uniref:Uncharacterized protein n=1 Tax=Caballeronia sordidicola TaxID=196367 RepID=A0A242N263_CABSO|nr:hypothetical protein PAMC26510_08845 [Caballeronia sordidicola]